ncbi:MAG: hydantoinase/oxoprolinase family protein, partial [Pseudomonadota bacterium]
RRRISSTSRKPLEVAEQTLADGTVVEAIDPDEVRAAALELLELGCEAVCIFFINGYANHLNEQEAAAVVREVWPTPYVTAATELLPEIREFERCSTATLNAYLQPVVANYLSRLQDALGTGNADSDIMIVQSNGGVMSVDTAARAPVRTALSGPAAGVIAARHIAADAGFDNIITCDMGGTSFDVSLVVNGESAIAPQTQIDFGMVVRTPMIEISTIGAGGGSIAYVDDGGLLEVGPDSAGSDPGPVAYGLGNDRPTVTDANLVLGRINPQRPLGGDLEQLDLPAAHRAIEERIAEPLGLDVMAAAEAIIRVANAKMAGAIRLVSIERGHDPARFAAMPFGGGGALHTGALLQEIGLAAAIVPRYPGVTSALGCVVADMRLDRVQTVNAMLADLEMPGLHQEMGRLADEFESELRSSAMALDGYSRLFELDMLYLGQTHTVTVPLAAELDEIDRTSIQASFQRTYQDTYGRLLEGIPARVVNLRVAVIGKRPPLDLSRMAPSSGKSLEDCRLGERQIWWDGSAHTAPVYERLDLPASACLPGPALLEQPDATVFIDPGLTGRVDRAGNVIIRAEDAG